MNSLVLAYSGGVDSTFLAVISNYALGNNMVAVIADSPSLPKSELDYAIEHVKKFKIPYTVIKTQELMREDYIKNNFTKDYKGKVFKISDKSVALIIKRYANKAGLDSSRYAGHSLRSGFATTAAEFGAEERNIMAMTGHKTTQMVRRYIQEANLFKNNALNKIKI